MLSTESGADRSLLKGVHDLCICGRVGMIARSMSDQYSTGRLWCGVVGTSVQVNNWCIPLQYAQCLKGLVASPGADAPVDLV